MILQALLPLFAALWGDQATAVPAPPIPAPPRNSSRPRLGAPYSPSAYQAANALPVGGAATLDWAKLG